VKDQLKGAVTMFYPKNVPNIERALRVLGGIALIALAAFGGPEVGGSEWFGAGLLVASAVVMIVTGFIGWCPACALIGRKIKANARQQSGS
jgi:hypothetical protein